MDAPKRTPQGGLRVPASLTRSGVFVYHRADGSEVREYRPEDEVFRPESLATLPGAPVTNEHPPVPVRSDNYGTLAKGHVGDSVVRNGERVAATLYVQDSTLVSAIERGDSREVSCGYSCEVEDTAGQLPDGTRYDQIQRNIEYNHVAIVPKGRAGSEVRLHLDSAGNVRYPAAPHKERTMKVEKIEGVEYEIDSPQYRAISQAHELINKTLAEKDKQQARADVAESKAKTLEGQIAEFPKQIDARANERLQLLDAARKVLGQDFRVDGKTDRDVMIAAVEHAKPTFKLEGKSDEYVRAAFDLLDQTPVSTLAGLRRSGVEVRADNADRDARSEMLERNRNAWKPKEIV